MSNTVHNPPDLIEEEIEKEEEEEEKKKELNNDYDLVVTQYKNNRKFEKSVSYYDFLLMSLKIAVSPMIRGNIFNLQRESKPIKDPKFYNEETFKSDLFVSFSFFKIDSSSVITSD